MPLPLGHISSRDDRFRCRWILPLPLALDLFFRLVLERSLGRYESEFLFDGVLGLPLIDCSVSLPILHLARDPETIRELGAFIGWQLAAMQDIEELVTSCSVLGFYRQLDQ